MALEVIYSTEEFTCEPAGALEIAMSRRTEPEKREDGGGEEEMNQLSPVSDSSLEDSDLSDEGALTPVGLPELPENLRVLENPGVANLFCRVMEDGLHQLDKLVMSMGGKPVPERETIHYNVTKGTCVGVELYVNHEFAIQLVWMSKGAYVPPHDHKKETELFLMLAGAMRLDVEEGGVVRSTALSAAQARSVGPGVVHAAEALKDCRYLAIGSPPIKGYPGVRQ